MTNGAEPRPAKAMAVTLKYKDADEHLLRRLGQAVVLQWDELPDNLQDVLIDQAAAVLDREADVVHDRRRRPPRPHKGERSGAHIQVWIERLTFIELNAERVQHHRHLRVLTRREHDVHALAFAEVRLERRPHWL